MPALITTQQKQISMKTVKTPFLFVLLLFLSMPIGAKETKDTPEQVNLTIVKHTNTSGLPKRTPSIEDIIVFYDAQEQEINILSSGAGHIAVELFGEEINSYESFFVNSPITSYHIQSPDNRFTIYLILQDGTVYEGHLNKH